MCKSGARIMLMSIITIFLAAAVGTVGIDAAAPASPATDPLVYVTTVTTGGQPDALAIDPCTSPAVLAYYDLSTSNVRFLDTSSLSLLPETLNLPSWNDKKWIVFDRNLCLGYVATTRITGGSITWQEARLHFLDGRSIVKTVSVNSSYNTGPSNLQDTYYKIEGLVLKQSGEEGSDPARIVLDNTRTGRIDVVDLTADGMDISRNQRFAYDERDLFGGELNFGNSLALDAKHETLASDDMVGVDRLYIADPNHASGTSGRGYIRVVQMGNPLLDLNATLLPEIDLGMTPPYFFQGPQGIAVAGARDRLYVASSSLSFNKGRAVQVNTANGSIAHNIDFDYEDTGKVLVDWYDPQRVFLATTDEVSNPTPKLYLMLIYDYSVIDTLVVVSSYDKTNSPLTEMAFDPVARKLYMGVGGQIYVIQVNYGLGPLPPPPQNPLYIPIVRKN
jgi:hypothetical protein